MLPPDASAGPLDAGHRIRLPATQDLVRWLGVAIAILVALSILVDVVRDLLLEGQRLARGNTVMGLFSLGDEDTVPTWFQTLLLAGIGGLLLTWRHQLTSATKYQWGWPLLGVTFLALSFDEMASVHERLTGPLQHALDIDSGPLFFAWVIPAAVAVVIFAAILVPFLLTLPRPTLIRFVAAGGVFVSGALLLEMLGGQIATSRSGGSFGYSVVTTAEEALEMCGALLFLRGILMHREALAGAH